MKYLIITCFFFFKPVLAKVDKEKLDNFHDSVSEKILVSSESLDSFLSRDSKKKLKNKTNLTLTLPFILREAKGPYLHPLIELNLALPKTEKRLQFHISSENSEKPITGEENPKNTLSRDERRTGAGLKYDMSNSKTKMSSEAGLILQSPLKSFIKLTAAKKYLLANDFYFKSKEIFKWVDTEGITSDLDLNFDYNLNAKTLFRFKNNIFWNNQNYIIRFQNGPSFFYKISERESIALHVHAITINQPELAVDDYLFQISYTKDLYKKWLLFEIGPTLNFPRAQDFRRIPSLLLQLQAKFGHL